MAQKRIILLQGTGLSFVCDLLYIVRRSSIFQTKSNHQITCSANSVSGSAYQKFGPNLFFFYLSPYPMLQNRHVDTYGPECKSG